jgi:hypothetical protein
MSNDEMEQNMENAATAQTAETVTEGGTNAVVAKREKSQLVAVEGGVLPIMPRSIEEAQRYASGLIAAGIVPDAFKFNKDVLPPPGQGTEPLARKGDVNAPLVLMGILKCLEIGVPPQTGLSGLLPLNGRFTVWGDLAAALVQRTGKVKNQTVVWTGPALDESLPLGDWPDDVTCEVRYWREGQDQPYIGRFSVRDAKKANLWMNQYKQPWIMYPKRMLYNRARAFALRDGFADGLHGLQIAEEVMDHMPTVEAEAQATTNMDALTADETTNNGAENGAGQL